MCFHYFHEQDYYQNFFKINEKRLPLFFTFYMSGAIPDKFEIQAL